MRDPSRFDISEILRERVNREGQFEQDRKIIAGYTLGVDSPVSPAVDGRDKFIWFRESGMNGAVHQVFNPDKIPLLIDFPCRVGHAPKEPYRWEVLDVDWGQLYHWTGYKGQNFGVGTHAPNHEWPDYNPATDVMSVYPRALAPLRTVPGSGLKVGVWAHRYFYSGVIWRFTGLAGADLSVHQPASGLACRVLVYLEKGTNVIKTVAGDTVTDSLVITPPDPVIPAVDGILSAWVRLDGDQSFFTESDIFDLRFTLNEISRKPLTASSTGVTLEELAHVESELDFAISKRPKLLSEIVFRQYGTTVNVLGSSTGAITLDLDLGNTFTLTQTGNITFTFLHPQVSGVKSTITLKITNDGVGSHARTWPVSVQWPGSAEPFLSGDALAEDIYTFFTVNGGITYDGFLPGADMG